MANVKKTVKKPAIKSKSKVVAGGKKARFSKPVLVLMVLGSLLVLTAAGTFGYSKWKENDLEAQAAGWTTLSNASTKSQNLVVKACKTYDPIGPDSANKTGSITFIVSKPAGSKPDVSIRLYKQRPIRPGFKNPIPEVTKTWGEKGIYNFKDTRQWWGDKVAVKKFDFYKDTITDMKVVLNVKQPQPVWKGLPPLDLYSENANGSNGYIEYEYAGYTSGKTAYLSTIKDYKSAEKHWVQNYAVSIPKITNCN